MADAIRQIGMARTGLSRQVYSWTIYSLRTDLAHEVSQGVPDFIGAILLKEMAAFDCYFGLVRPSAAKFSLPADQNRTWVCIDEELWDIGFGEPAGSPGRTSSESQPRLFFKLAGQESAFKALLTHSEPVSRAQEHSAHRQSLSAPNPLPFRENSCNQRTSGTLTFLGALFLHSIVERLLRGLRRDYWRSLWTRSREGKGSGWQLLRSL